MYAIMRYTLKGYKTMGIRIQAATEANKLEVIYYEEDTCCMDSCTDDDMDSCTDELELNEEELAKKAIEQKALLAKVQNYMRQLKERSVR